jgi:ribosomal protein S8
MTTSITLQLPDDIAQQLQTEAQKQNTTPENIAAQCLMQTLRPNQNPQSLLAKTDEPLDKNDPLLQMFNRIYEANQIRQDRIQAKVTPLTRQIADSLLKQQLIDRIEIDDTQIDVMILYLPVNPAPPPQFGPVNYLQEFPTDDPEKRQILQKLQDPDPNVRIQGITALRDRCLELT